MGVGERTTKLKWYKISNHKSEADLHYNDPPPYQPLRDRCYTESIPDMQSFSDAARAFEAEAAESSNQRGME